MSAPVHSDPTSKERRAVAPYNFVPLPEKMVEANTPPPQDVFDPDLLTGSIDIEIKSCSPVYIRGMYTVKQYKQFGNKKSKELTPHEKDERAPFYAIQENPAIPGSSLRGMLRELVEIVSSGRMRWVSKSPTFTYRAVADKSDDPLKRKYKDIFGVMAKNVRAGYLIFENGSWYIQPAQTADSAGLGKGYYLKVYEEDIEAPSYIPMHETHYRPQVISVSFQPNGRIRKSDDLVRKAQQRNKNKKNPKQPDIKFDRVCYSIQAEDQNLSFAGSLVTSGNMRETGGASSARDKNYIFLPKNEKAKRLHIPNQVIEDYRAGLTPYQLDSLRDWRDGIHDESWGCLGHDKPVFYISNESDPNKVQYFGHNPNFRIPVMLDGSDRAANPLDFVPNHLLDNPNSDMADAIFGWVEELDEKHGESAENRSVAGPTKQRAGRVFFSDAMYTDDASGVWYNGKEPITPKILSNPKPTTFQHYLIQDKTKGHDPDEKEALAHYGTPPSQTGIRGYKFYWHKGSDPDIKYAPTSSDNKRPEDVLTRIIPIKSEVCFESKIHFENLRPEELGVLCWVLMLPGQTGKTYRHKIGMGKPLGMGAVQITLKNINLSLRKDIDEKNQGRYSSLLNNTAWFLPDSVAKNAEDFILAFEDFMRQQKALGEGEKISEKKRIQDLLELLCWNGDDVEKDFIESTRYMEIEHDTNGNEYKERPVLPSPFGVWAKLPAKDIKSASVKNEYSMSNEKRPAHHTTDSSQSVKGKVKWCSIGQQGTYHGYVIVDSTQEEIHFNERDLKNSDNILKQGDRVEFCIVKKGGRTFANSIRKA